MSGADFSGPQLALLLHEANFAAWESVASALNRLEDAAPHPRIGWLRTHLRTTKRGYWEAIAAATGGELPPETMGLRELLTWEVERARTLSPQALATVVEYCGERLSVSEIVRLGIRHSLWHAGQLAAPVRVQHA